MSIPKSTDYASLRRPPADALKTIEAGRLRGKSDINPQWRIDTMNESFGLCGFGWKWELVKTWSEPGNDNEVFAFAHVYVRVKIGDEWSEPIPGTGGHKLIMSERGGMHNNDEAYKMAITDALSVALKFLGVGAEIYRNHIDSKYAVNTHAATQQQINNTHQAQATPQATPQVTQQVTQQTTPQTPNKEKEYKVKGTITRKAKKQSETYTKYGFVIADVWYNSFDPDVDSFNEGDSVELYFTVNKYGNQITKGSMRLLTSEETVKLNNDDLPF